MTMAILAGERGDDVEGATVAVPLHPEVAQDDGALDVPPLDRFQFCPVRGRASRHRDAQVSTPSAEPAGAVAHQDSGGENSAQGQRDRQFVI